jgi:hypothetical protein
MAKLRATVNVTIAKTVDGDLAANLTITTVTTNVTVPGVKAGQFYLVAMANADLTAGLLLQGVVYCEADGVLIIRTVNPTAGTLNPSAADLHVIGL